MNNVREEPDDTTRWVFGQILLIAIPIVIYVMFYALVFEEPRWAVLSHKPEWMFVALMYNVETLRDSVELQHSRVDFPMGNKEANVILSLVLILISSVTLFAVLSRYEEAIRGSTILSITQWVVLFLALSLCAITKHRLRRVHDTATLLDHRQR